MHFFFSIEGEEGRREGDGIVTETMFPDSSKSRICTVPSFEEVIRVGGPYGVVSLWVKLDQLAIQSDSCQM